MTGILADQLAKVNQLLNGLEWNWVDELHDHVEVERDQEAYVIAAEERKYDNGLSEKEEIYERRRWLRCRQMWCRMDEFRQVTRTLHTVFIELSQAGCQQILGERAGLQPLTPSEQPSELVRFRLVYPPDPPPLGELEYERKVGGPHVLGARLIWWCAAFESPEEFDFSGDFKLWTEPIWAVDDAIWTVDEATWAANRVYTVRANRRALLLIRDAASEVCRLFDALTESGPQSGEQAPPRFGPWEGYTFWWEGKKPVHLSPLLWKLLSFMWKHRYVDRDRVMEQVWSQSTTPSNFDSAKSRLNAILSKNGIPVEISSTRRCVRLEISRS